MNMLWHATFLPKHQDGIMHMLRLNENRLIAVAIIRQALKKNHLPSYDDNPGGEEGHCHRT